MSRARTVRTGTVLVLAAAGAIGYLVHASTGSAGEPVAPTPSSTVPAPAAPAAVVPPEAVRAAGEQLAELRIAAAGSMAGYSAEKFPHWSSQGQGCDTRDRVLQRQGQDVTTGPDCTVSGRWYSPYDGATWTKTSDVDIDHVVPRGNAWVSGAASWSQQRREEFANDLTRPELVAVTDNLNQAKGDRGPDAWKPPLSSDFCRYSVDWIAVKHHYQLTVTAAEHAALADMLGTCPRSTR